MRAGTTRRPPPPNGSAPAALGPRPPASTGAVDRTKEGHRLDGFDDRGDARGDERLVGAEPGEAAGPEEVDEVDRVGDATRRGDDEPGLARRGHGSRSAR